MSLSDDETIDYVEIKSKIEDISYEKLYSIPKTLDRRI